MKLLDSIQSALEESWSIESSSKWTKENPAKGQCSVSAVVVYQYFGGEILKTKIDGRWHFYNKINGIKYDFTSGQFEKEIEYSDILSSVEEAEKDSSPKQIGTLMEAFGSKIEFSSNCIQRIAETVGSR